MKAVPVGPITRLAAFQSTDSGLLYSRNDWSVGRDLRAEEVRSGIVLTTHEVANPGAKRIEAVVKAQPSDFQISAIGAHDGSIAALLKERRARWRKMSRPTYYLAESTATSFSDPDKSFSPVIQSHGEYVRRQGRLPEEKPLLQFVLYRDRHTMKEVLSRFRYEIGATADAFSLAVPPGGSYACVTQFGTAIGVTKEQLVHASRRYNLHPLLLDPRKYYEVGQFAALTQPPLAYQYRILLRFVGGGEACILQRLRQWTETGFLNYFGLDCFGASTSALFDLGAFAHRADHRRAVGAFLQSVAESDPFHYPFFLAYVNSEASTTVGLLEKWIDACAQKRNERQLRDVLVALKAHHDATQGGPAATMADVWGRVPLGRRAHDSAAEFVWNAMVSQRIFSRGLRVVKGDLVAAADVAGGRSVHLVASATDAERFSIFDVVMPVPYNDGCENQQCLYPTVDGAVSREAYVQFASKHSLSFLFDKNSTATSTTQSPAPSYRSICSRPQTVSSCILNDPSSLTTLKDDLFLLRERKENSLNDLSLRLREPSIFNMSERLHTKTAVCEARTHGHVLGCLVIYTATEHVSVGGVEGGFCSPVFALHRFR
ncbi:tRNA pseudouridine13 synthase [Strigomonas culicis]|uniref:tRNA pseudouridine13 synthase n=1 Tax=Strigomonas culicis TaxID=28005 RepID=S9VL63_9TRYP|nr:tRNA pseudouridine13 synthase [Strigomonas culicis]|eukprot:EPY27861.1 tRNA pseudouridine13 synthase [Strigomonas culicis]